MLFQKLDRFEEPIPLFRGNEGQFRAHLRNLVLDRLDPSQALYAIRSPRPAQKFRDQHAPPQKAGKGQYSLAVCSFERKFRSPRPNLQGFGVIQHLGIDCKSTETQGQPRKGGANQRRHGFCKRSRLAGRRSARRGSSR